jgi:heme exporter protein CcmD
VSAIAIWAAMGPHGAFVWSSYGVTVAVLGGLAFYVWWRYRASLRDLDRLQSGPSRRQPGGR